MLRFISALLMIVAASADGESPRALSEKKVKSFKVCTADGTFFNGGFGYSSGKKIYKCGIDNKPTTKLLGSTDYICYPNSNDYTCQQSFYFKNGAALNVQYKETIQMGMYEDSYWTFQGLEKWKDEAKNLKEIKHTVRNALTPNETYEFVYNGKGYDFSNNYWSESD